MESREKNLRRWMIAGLLGLMVSAIVVTRSGGVRGSIQLAGWLAAGIHQKIFPGQNAAGPIYGDTAKGPLALATSVGQLCVAWPGESAAVVHGAAAEIAADLLHHGDIEVGDLAGEKFVPWPMTPWAAEEKIRSELSAQPAFFTDERRIVFRRKPAVTR